MGLYMGPYMGLYMAPYICPCIGRFWLTIRCCSHALPHPQVNADDAAIRCRSLVVQRVGLLEQNSIWQQAMRIVELFTVAISSRGRLQLRPGLPGLDVDHGPVVFRSGTLVCFGLPPDAADTRCRSPKRMLMSQPSVAAAH